MWNKIAAKVVEQKNLVGIDQTKMMAAEMKSVVNEMRREGGFSPAQWVL